jgi:multiple sugar transport system permease protein
MLRRLIIYMMLITGTVVFSIPFLWMAVTSVKVDREMFSRQLRVLPMAPSAPNTSPYLDHDYYADLEGPHQEQLFQTFAEIARNAGLLLPNDVDNQITWHHIGRGLYEKMWRSLPPETWASGPQAIEFAAESAINLDETVRVVENVVRRLSFGSMRARSHDLQVQDLGAGLPYDQRLLNESPGVVTPLTISEEHLTYASINYDFSDEDQASFSGTFDLEFDASELQRLQLNIKPDDSWHELWLTMEKQGVRYEAERPLVLANFTWATATWQEPGPDDLTNKIKTWILLRPVGQSEGYVSDPRKIRVGLELRRSGLLTAWWHKLSRNYYLVWDHIPFWTYVKTSLFLVGTSILLTLFSCSIIAYAFARLYWPGREFCFVLMLATMMIPPQVTMIPHFLIWKTLGAYDTLFPLWAGNLFGNAFFIFLLRQFMKGIPKDLEDSARIDGCGFLRIYWHIILPLMKPSLAAIAIFTFMSTWNDFMGPLIYLADQRLYPLAFGLYAFAVQVENNPALTMAASLLMTLPVILLFFLAQRYFIEGTTLTGLKG